MGVIYESGDDVTDLLVPFVAARSPATRERVGEVYRRCFVGRISAAELWRELDVEGDAATLDEEYLAAHRLVEGLRGFLSWCGKRRLRVACLSNDVGEWSRRLRARHSLDGAIDPWVISGDVGSRKPEPAIYARLLDALGVAPGRVLFVDDRERNLDAAAALGLRTARFGAGAADSRHPIIPDYASLRALIDR